MQRRLYHLARMPRLRNTKDAVNTSVSEPEIFSDCRASPIATAQPPSGPRLTKCSQHSPRRHGVAKMVKFWINLFSTTFCYPHPKTQCVSPPCLAASSALAIPTTNQNRRPRHLQARLLRQRRTVGRRPQQRRGPSVRLLRRAEPAHKLCQGLQL
jgi:hypothetical protein